MVYKYFQIIKQSTRTYLHLRKIIQYPKNPNTDHLKCQINYKITSDRIYLHLKKNIQNFKNANRDDRKYQVISFTSTYLHQH